MKARIDNEMSVSMAEKSFAWKPLLRAWSQEWLTSAEYRSTLSDEVIASGWLGSPGASEEQITSAEQWFGVALPHSESVWQRTRPLARVQNTVRSLSPTHLMPDTCPCVGEMLQVSIR